MNRKELDEEWAKIDDDYGKLIDDYGRLIAWTDMACIVLLSIVACPIVVISIVLLVKGSW